VVSSPDFSLGTVSGGTAVPALTTRTAETTLQLKDGQTFVVAGLLREEMSTNVQKFPFLGDLPVFGTLFTSKEFRSTETELIILVTPHLVRPLNPGEVPDIPNPLPYEDVGDLDFFILNNLYGRQPSDAGEPAAAASRETPAFIGEKGLSR
jgi:pilus assembly protein CpaC